MHTGDVNPKLPKEAAADFPNKQRDADVVARHLDQD